MSKRTKVIHVIEHWAIAEPDAGRRHLIASGFDVRVHDPWRGEALPVLSGDEAGLMVMGGPQMVSEHEQWPYLADEFRLIEQAMKLDIPLIGICLGSQMIAHVLGATVRYADRGALSMGFYETRATDAAKGFLPETMMTLNGNAQGFDLPSGATLLATSDETVHPNQAFRHGDKVLALQFHPEVTRAILDQWQTEFADLVTRPGSRSIEEQNAGFAAHNARLKAWYQKTLDGWFN